MHRDVSPQNVLMSFEGEVKLTDFGIATAAERLHKTAAGVVKGKYAYMAPERLQETPFDGRVDVFSAGVLLYELLAGENPFAGPSAVETIENVLNKDVPPPSARGASTTDALDRICLKALAKTPEDRYPHAQAFADALTEYAMAATDARKEMAAGDTTVSQTLQQLFPDKSQAPSPADPGSIALPGVNDTSDVGSLSTDRKNQVVSADAFRPEDLITDEELPKASPLEETEDFDAPTLMRMTPVKPNQQPQLIEVSQDELPPLPDAPGGSRVDSGMSTIQESSSGDPTAPSKVPDMHSDPRLSGDLDDDFMDDTVQSSTVGPMQADPQADTFPPSQGAGLSSPSVSRPGEAAGSSGSISSSSGGAPLVVPVASSGEMPLTSTPSVAPVATTPSRSGIGRVAAVLLAGALLVIVGAVVMMQRSETMSATAQLTVTTVPSGATVLINGTEHGQKTPCRLDIPADVPVSVRLEQAGYQTFEKKLVPREGTSITIDETLVTSRATLAVEPIPTEAEIKVNGVERGKGTVEITELPVGKTSSWK